MAYDKALFSQLYDGIKDMRVIDCHEHMQGLKGRPGYKEPIASLIHGYVSSDLQAAAFGVPETELATLQDESVSTDKKWPLFERLWRATEHTAYARVTKLVLKNQYGIDRLTRDSLESVRAKLSERTDESYFETIDSAGIDAMIVDVLGWLGDDFPKYLAGDFVFPEKWKLMVSLPSLHPTTANRGTIDGIGRLTNASITSIDGFLEAVFSLIKRCVERGAVGLKDQSAYQRVISYDLVPRADDDRKCNRILSDANESLGWPESKPLNDFLFHRYMEFAKELDLPVQLHTGHMAGIRNRVGKTNAAHLTSMLEVHRDVNFDLFHGNWPYLGDLLFLGKNYPNVSLDLCWLHIIDPDYSVELLERATKTLPHTKIHGFGGDYGDVPEYAAAHLEIAKENIAVALTRLVESRWIDEEEALHLAQSWLFDNPNRFFKLGL